MLVEEKIRRNLDPLLAENDIIPLVNGCRDASFARTANNKKAIVSRGWGPLNYAQLAYSEEMGTKTNGEIGDDDDDNNHHDSNQPLTLALLNTGEATVVKQFDRFLQRRELVEKSEQRRK